MEDEIVCPKCHKRNDIQKFCVYCGHRLLDDNQIRLILDNLKPYCLNCGRTVVKDRTVCECGYEFRDISCPQCNSRNAYTNRFCTACGKKLWTSNVSQINYAEISSRIIRDNFPKEMRNTMLYLRYKQRFTINFPDDFKKIGEDIKELQSNKSRIDNHLNEIISRWKIVAPNYCINCLRIIKPNKCSCRKCGTIILDCKKSVDCIKNKKYVRPTFDMVELKWNSKFGENYLDSLAPAIGESQFDYRERLKWEFAENNNLKISIANAIYRILEREERERKKREEREKWERESKRREEELKKRKKREEEYMRQYGGGFCDSRCRHCDKEFYDTGGKTLEDLDNDGNFGDYCRLGHSISFGSYCKDYEE